MNDLKTLEHLAPIADEMLAGLHADENMKRRILMAARQKAAPRRALRTFAPALCCAALALVCVGVIGLYGGGDGAGDGTITIDTIAAGSKTSDSGLIVADLGDGAQVRAAGGSGGSLFASGAGDMPLVTVDGAVYRMLTKPQNVGASLLGGEIGQIAAHVEEPSLASEEEMNAGLSNIAEAGVSVYAVADVASTTLVAAQVDGKTRLFQRVSYAGKGPSGQTLEDTFSVRGQVSTLELSGVGTLTGEQANAVVDVLLDNATLKAADTTASRQMLTVTLDNGLQLQLGVSGDMLCGCGGWSCPEFFETFEAALAEG